ncbi:proton-coupled folate transporter-like [Patiria miniata]|uniref:Uncharacterized protein n=1 Tax=Patiria miniata TaxID=46514 RepID=A0A913ZE44_PATMI|nr:proton-coupled folate transporter-like [Patiria miniata]XP_038050058.1 proton-coupled folate transporter-like [Patiria miniata]
MTEPPSEDSPLLNQDGVRGRSVWTSMALFLVFQILILIPGELVMATLGVQFARSTFVRQRNFTLPVGGNACDSSNISQELNDIQSETALFSTYQSFLVDLIPVVTGLPLTAVSDYTGRRPIILLRCLGPLIMATGFLVVSYFELSVYYALIGSAVFGISGGYVLLNSVSLLYVTDIVSAKQRGVALATIYGTQNTVMYLAPFILNSLLGALSSFTTIYLIVTCFALLALLWMLPPGIIRESVEKRPVDLRDLAGSVTRGIRNVFASSTEGRRWRIVLIFVCYAVISFTLYGFQNTVDLYALGKPFCWTPAQVGVYSLVYGVPNAVVAPFIVWFLERVLSDYWAIYLSVMCGVAQYLLTAVATTNAVLVYGATWAGLIFGISQPVYVTLLTRLVNKHSHGALFSVFTLVYSLGSATSLIVQSYAYSLAVLSGHARDLFFVMAGLIGITFIPTVVLHILEPKEGFEADCKITGKGGPNVLDGSTQRTERC